MRAREIARRILDLGGREVRRGKGSHVRYSCRCGRWFTTVPIHAGEDVKRGTAKGIEKDLELCLGKGWLDP